MSLTPASARSRVEANRQNARKSTGPRTVEGKQRSSLNALRHGLASVSILAPRRGEDAWEFSLLRTALMEQYQPANITEAQLVELVASTFIRVRRSEAIDTALMDGSMAAIQNRNGRVEHISANEDLGAAVALGDSQNQLALHNLHRYRIRAHMDYHKAIDQLVRLQTMRRDEQVKEIRRQKEIDGCHQRTIAHPGQLPYGFDSPNEATSEPISAMPATSMASFGTEKKPASDLSAERHRGFMRRTYNSGR